MASFQFKDFLRICSENKKLLIVLFLAVSIPMLVGSMFRPVYYQATAKILVEHSRKANIELSGTLSERASEYPPAPARVNSLLEVVKSGSLAWQVARALHPDKREEEIAEVATLLRNRIEARVIPASTIIEISYSDKDPKNAQKVVRMFAETFQKAAGKLIEGEDLTGFYQGQLKWAEKKFVEAHEALRELQLKEGVFSRISEEQKLVESERTNIRSKVMDADLKIGGLVARIAALERQIKDQPERIRISTETVVNQEFLSLKDRLNALESERTNLLTKYNEGDRLVQDKAYEINQLKNRIEKIAPVVENRSIDSINPVRQQLEENLLGTRASLDEAIRIRDDGAAKTRIMELQLVRLSKHAFDFMSYEQAADAGRKDYSVYLNKLSDANFVDTMIEQNISTVSIVDMPQQPEPQESSPIRSTAIPLAFGALVAFSAVFMKERVTPRVGNGERAAEFLKLPVLARVPEVKSNGVNGVNGAVDGWGA
jgi:polysaccharide biosynthesis transport protein